MSQLGYLSVMIYQLQRIKKNPVIYIRYDLPYNMHDLSMVYDS